MISNIFDDIRKNQLYRSSFFLTSSRFVNAGIGFIFWVIAAKVYSVKDVGIATNLISSMGIIMLFSKFGFDISLIRYINIGNNAKEKEKVFNTSLCVTIIATIIIGIIYLIGINYSSGLNIRGNYMVIFLFSTVMQSIVTIVGVGLTAIRKANYYFIQNFLLAIRVPLLIPLAFLGSFGIFSSVGLSYFIAGLISLLYMNRSIKVDFNIDKKFIKESFIFSSGNYLSNVFFTVPALILPILVLNILGEVEAARYYIAFAIGSLVLIIPTAVSTSLYVEGSHGENLRKNVYRTILVTYAILIPCVIFIYYFGGFFLSMIGKDYVDSIQLLRIIALSSFLITINNIYIAIDNIRMKIENNVKLNLALFLLLPTLSYFLILKYGIIGVGYAWVITYMLINLSIVFLIKKEGWI